MPKKPDKPPAPVTREAFSIPEFCEAYRISESFYYKLRAAGLGPRECRTLNKTTISTKAAAAWQKESEAETAREAPTAA
jgi:hypothetical protein